MYIVSSCRDSLLHKSIIHYNKDVTVKSFYDVSRYVELYNLCVISLASTFLLSFILSLFYNI